MQLIINICNIIGAIIAVCIAYKVIFIVVGVFAKKTFKPTENKHKFAILISARNEEKVIKNLLESVYAQDYPKDKLSVFVMAHNCTDKTAEIVREYALLHADQEIVAYEYNNSQEKTKGFALKKLLSLIDQDYGYDHFEGYFIFDADNVLAKNYVTKMNEAFDAGNKVVTSFRNSKNINQNWISFAYASHWMRTCLYENRAKAILKQSCRVQGTGYLFASELIKDGWDYTSLTEDRQFCTAITLDKYRVSYCDEAVFYDEQPYKLKVSFRQLLRWRKGHLYSATHLSPKLVGGMVKRSVYFPVAWDMFWLNFPFAIESAVRNIITFVCSLIIAIQASTVLPMFTSILIGLGVGVIGAILAGIIQMIPIFIVYKNRVEKTSLLKTIFYMCMFPMFDILGSITYYIALFIKIEWKPIPHDQTVDIEKINARH
ncbi:MAG: glycosyltransferase family 2 protein [Clostridia bacterium]|nr:glycosyltransferase family 2 protein [Clostridia bacterium]